MPSQCSDCPGLGGEYMYIFNYTNLFHQYADNERRTTTMSLANGALVLQHETGHSFINVGDEYDRVFAYFGISAVHILLAMMWMHWLEHPKEGAAMLCT